MTEDECKSLAVIAFKETDAAKKQLGTAVQRMAAAIMAHHANMVANASKGTEIVRLSTVCHPDEAMARAALQKALVYFFIPGRVITAVKTDTAKAAKRDAEANHVKLIRDGLDLSSTMSLHMIDLSSYDKSTGLWNVPIQLFCSTGFSVETDAKTLPMDGTAWVARKLVAGGKPEYESFMSSVARFKEMCKPRMARAGNAGQGATGADATEGKVTIRSKIADLLLNLRATDKGKPVYPSLSTLEDADRNALVLLVRWYDNAKAADAAKPGTRKPADEKAAPSKAA
jgi:hypothetical protein